MIVGNQVDLDVDPSFTTAPPLVRSKEHSGHANVPAPNNWGVVIRGLPEIINRAIT